MAQWVKVKKPIAALQRQLKPGNVVEMEDWMAEMYIREDMAEETTYNEAMKYYRRMELVNQGLDPGSDEFKAIMEDFEAKLPEE